MPSGTTCVHGEELLGDDGEGTVDGSHPTDLGLARQAAVFARALAPLLPPGSTLLVAAAAPNFGRLEHGQRGWVPCGF